MGDLDPAHVEAVAQVLMAPRMFTNMSGDKQRHDAAAILTSTDPAVHSALLAALVRAGVPDDRAEAEIRADEIEHILTHILTGPRSPATNALERRLAGLRDVD